MIIFYFLTIFRKCISLKIKRKYFAKIKQFFFYWKIFFVNQLFLIINKHIIFFLQNLFSIKQTVLKKDSSNFVENIYIYIYKVGLKYVKPLNVRASTEKLHGGSILWKNDASSIIINSFFPNPSTTPIPFIRLISSFSCPNLHPWTDGSGRPS